LDLNQLFFKYCVYLPVVRLRGERVPYYLDQLTASQWASPREIRHLQDEKVKKLLLSARSEVPHYQQSLKNRVVPPSFSLEDLRSLPFITKSDLQASQVNFLHPGRRGRMAKKTTGGSTGHPVTIWKTAKSMAQESAANWRGFGWAGIKVGDRQGRFWGVPFAQKDRLRARLIDFVNHRRRCSAFSFRSQDMQDYTRLLNRFKPRYLYGYVSMLAAYAEFLRSTGTGLKFDLQAVVTTSEVLTPSHRQLFREVFRTNVYNEYGCGELGTIAHECEKGRMHINAENLVVEILDGERPCDAGEIGELVMTDLNNEGMPLIRYRLGDFGSFSETPCECGRGLPVIRDIVGRAYDLVYNREGKSSTVNFLCIFSKKPRKKALASEPFRSFKKTTTILILRSSRTTAMEGTRSN
jgi:phenylacetate-CoA ligase